MSKPPKLKKKSEDHVIICNGFQAFKAITHSGKCILGNDTEMWGTYSNWAIPPHILISLKQVLMNETWLAI